MPGAREITIALSGGLGSGKSTTAAELAQRLGGTVASFGDFVRHLATQLGEPTDRPTLQRIGHERVEADANAFVVAFLSWASPPADQILIIDGVRHVSVDAALRSRASAVGEEYFLIVIQTTTQLRADRRHDGNERIHIEVENHPVEREAIEQLPAVADFVVDGDAPPATVASRIIAEVRGRLTHR